MNWRMAAMLCAALMCPPLAPRGARDQKGLQPTQVESFTAANEVVRYLSPPDVSPGDARVLDRPEVAELFGRYRYAWRGTPWQFREIVSPLVHRHAIFLFFASGGLDDYSELTVLLDRASGQGYLIPIQNHSMVEYPHVEDDPHNIAIFNMLVNAESVHAESATNWLELALLYLNLVGERHQVTDWEDLTGAAHPGMLSLLPKLKNLNLLPRVSCGAGKCDVNVFDPIDKKQCVVWELEFDSQSLPPRLVDVEREVQPIASPSVGHR